MKFFNPFLGMIALLLLHANVHAGTPQSTMYCIDDSTEFTSVLATLNGLSAHDRNYDLRFRPGTFASNTTYPVAANFNALIAWRPLWVTAFTNYTFKLSGEWNAGCSAQNPPGGTTSTINGLDTNIIFYTAEVQYTATNYTPLVFDFNRIDFWRFAGYAISASAPGSGHNVQITNNRFRSGIGTAVSSDADSIVILNSLFENNSTGSSFFSLVDIDSEGATTMSNNTFRNNTLPSGSGTKVVVELGNSNNATPSGMAVFENNVIYQTSMSSFSYLLSTDLQARVKNNIFDSTLVTGTPLFISNNYNVDPKFAFSSGAQVMVDSPSRDLGNNATANGATIDLYGRTRVQNMVVDLGAYELSPPVLVDELFANSFE